jgi:hypothetical protein
VQIANLVINALERLGLPISVTRAGFIAPGTGSLPPRCRGDASSPLGNLQPPHHGWTRYKGLEYPADVTEVQLTRLVETAQVADPRKGSGAWPRQHSGRGAACPRTFQTCGTYLTKHRTYAAHLKHQPLHSRVATGSIRWQQLAGLLRQVQQNGTRFEPGQRPSARTLRIENGRNLVVGIE